MRRLIAVLFCIGCVSPPIPAAPVIAAASDLRFAMREMLDAFGTETGRTLHVAFGSSGNFARQIGQGAPFEIFFSADEAFVRRLAVQGVTRDEGALYAIGRIVLFARHGSPLEPDPQLRHLRELLEQGDVVRFAIANPDHAPYGRAAQQALTAAGLWVGLRAKLVLGENVSQAAQFSSVGDVTGGIFAYSLALAPPMRAKGRFVLLPEQLHQPLRQRMVLMKGAGATAERFYAYVQTARARVILTRHGFLLPEQG